MRQRIRTALDLYAHAQDERREAQRRWNDAFWREGEAAPPPRADLVALETERRAASERCVKPTAMFGFLADEEFVPPVKFRLPGPEEVFSRWKDVLADPEALYAAPETMPDVEASQRVPGPSGPEYIVRFRSPSRFTGDTAYARIYEPEKASGGLPTLIYGGGFGMMYDQLTYWPEEEYMGRYLAARGYRVILIESPWHGRRTLPGYYSGEPYLANAPAGLFQLYSAQVQETAVLIQWARSIGAPVVGVGGMSLGGTVAQQVAGRCGSWPDSMKPDMVFLGASSSHLDQVVLHDELSHALGLDRAIRAAGWTEENLADLTPVLDPPQRPGIPPEKIFAFLGLQDTYIPYRRSREMLRDWDVPEENIVSWDTGHFGILVRIIRTSEFQERIMQAMRGIERGQQEPERR
ncbi:hypothetical protein ASZ90_009553 [hydrocarbon metagenome]|uniref:Uncharacterized protein n=1 Tax=hydrocarbon metagenome TaxID=938273 RepID=A0A0W8FIH3_9ZZZZ